MLLQRSELTALLNYLYEKNPYFEIKTKVVGSILAVDLEDDTVRIYLDEREFDDRAFKYENLLPDASNYKTALLSAGILKPRNLDETFNEIVKEFKKSMYDRPRPLYISFDTNAFINRTSYHFQTFAERNKSVLGAFIVAEGVKLELFSEKTGKYSEFELRELITRDKKFKEFINQSKVIDRILKIGRAEFNRFRRSVRFEEIPSERGDNEIVRALREFSKMRDCDVWLITFDKTMYEISAGHGIKPLLLEVPSIKKEKIRTEWENVRDLIYTAAVIFGVITISGIDIFGIWRGKNPIDWDNECVKVSVKDEKLERDLKILREIKEISNLV